MANGGSRRPRKGSKSGRKNAGTQTSTNGVQTKLVPWDPQLNMTDNLRINPVSERTFSFIQTGLSRGWLTSSSVSDASNTLTVTLGNLAITNFSAIGGLFDQYRIDCVEAWLTPTVTAGIGQFTTSPDLYTVLDYDDATSLTSVQVALGYANLIRSTPFEKQRRCFKPRVAYAVYSGAFTSFANQQAGWIDVASSDVAHYGMKAICEADGGDVHQVWDLTYRAHLSLRAVR